MFLAAEGRVFVAEGALAGLGTGESALPRSCAETEQGLGNWLSTLRAMAALGGRRLAHRRTRGRRASNNPKH